MKSRSPCPVCGCHSKWYVFDYSNEELLITFPECWKDLFMVDERLIETDFWNFDYCEGCDTVFTGTL